MTTSAPIDAAIETAASGRWSKVAMIMARVHKALKEEVEFDVILDRIKAMVEAGILEAAGNLDKPRRSEVRLADPQPSESR